MLINLILHTDDNKYVIENVEVSDLPIYNIEYLLGDKSQLIFNSKFIECYEIEKGEKTLNYIEFSKIDRISISEKLPEEFQVPVELINIKKEKGGLFSE